MSRKQIRSQNASNEAADRAAIEIEVSRIQNLKPDQLRGLWRDVFKKQAPKAFTRDLLAKALCWHVQEQAFGGHSPATLKLLTGYAKGRPSEGRNILRLKPGTELVREYQGERHVVVITGQGFQWKGQNYSSLTAIAQAITGTNWNGPRFFGLREDRKGSDAGQTAARNSVKAGQGLANPEGATHG